MLAPSRLHHPGDHNVNRAMSALRIQTPLLIKQTEIWIEAGVFGLRRSDAEPHTPKTSEL